MNLIDELVLAFKTALTEVFTLEADKTKNYMNQTILGCRWRAFWGIFVAVKKSNIINILALSIAKHRQENHNEDKTRTIKSISRSLTNEQIKASTAKSGWIS